jgi:hypothetical protein
MARSLAGAEGARFMVVGGKDMRDGMTEDERDRFVKGMAKVAQNNSIKMIEGMSEQVGKELRGEMERQKAAVKLQQEQIQTQQGQIQQLTHLVMSLQGRAPPLLAAMMGGAEWAAGEQGAGGGSGQGGAVVGGDGNGQGRAAGAGGKVRGRQRIRGLKNGRRWGREGRERGGRGGMGAGRWKWTVHLQGKANDGESTEVRENRSTHLRRSTHLLRRRRKRY